MEIALLRKTKSKLRLSAPKRKIIFIKLVLTIFLFGSFLLLSNKAKASEAETAKAAFLFAYHNPAINQICSPYPSSKMAFCQEGYGAAWIQKYRAKDVVSKLFLTHQDRFLNRLWILGFGIGAAQFPNSYVGDVIGEINDLGPITGFKSYLIDGVGMGLYVTYKAELKKAFSACRLLNGSVDRKLCFFGIGRASFFAQNDLFLKSDQGLASVEKFDLKQGYFYASLFAGQQNPSSQLVSEPGIMAAFFVLKKPLSAAVEDFFIKCNSRADQHHYLCALNFSRPDMLFLREN